MTHTKKKEEPKNSPYKVLAMRTECWLFEESGNEAMILDVKDVLLFQCTFPISVSDIDFILLLLGHIIVSHFEGLLPLFRLLCVDNANEKSI